MRCGSSTSSEKECVITSLLLLPRGCLLPQLGCLLRIKLTSSTNWFNQMMCRVTSRRRVDTIRAWRNHVAHHLQGVIGQDQLATHHQLGSHGNVGQLLAGSRGRRRKSTQLAMWSGKLRPASLLVRLVEEGHLEEGKTLKGVIQSTLAIALARCLE